MRGGDTTLLYVRRMRGEGEEEEEGRGITCSPHAQRAPVETFYKFPRVPNGHPWKHFSRSGKSHTWKPVPWGTRGNFFLKCAPTGTRGNRSPVETCRRAPVETFWRVFGRRPDFAKKFPRVPFRRHFGVFFT